MPSSTLAVALVLGLTLAWVAREPLYSNFIILLIFNRGLIAPSQFWWAVSDALLGDEQSGVQFYKDLKAKHGAIVPINLFGEQYRLVTDAALIEPILQQSPHTFGAGPLKCKFFSTFMAKNVGISHGAEWEHRRMVNEYALMTDRVHSYVPLWDERIDELLWEDGTPLNFDQFSTFGRRMTAYVVFGLLSIPDYVFDIFNEANTLRSLFTDFDLEKYRYTSFLLENIRDPQPQSLVALGNDIEGSEDELLHQVPHWIFPCVGLFNATAPRLLVLLYNHPASLQIVRDGDQHYLRNCILETLRLNNVVASTFRTVLQDNGPFKQGDKLLILNNPVLRDPDYFPDPHRFIPERWTEENEAAWYAIMWNQGPQRCPAKEICISLISSFVTKWLEWMPYYTAQPDLNTSSISQMINPFNIYFV